MHIAHAENGHVPIHTEDAAKMTADPSFRFSPSAMAIELAVAPGAILGPAAAGGRPPSDISGRGVVSASEDSLALVPDGADGDTLSSGGISTSTPELLSPSHNVHSTQCSAIRDLNLFHLHHVQAVFS